MSVIIVDDNPDGQRRTLHIIYALHAFGLGLGAFGAASVVGSFLFGWPSIIAVVLSYIHRDKVRGTWMASHVDWVIRTFSSMLRWRWTLVVVVGSALLMLQIGFATLPLGMFLLGVLGDLPHRARLAAPQGRRGDAAGTDAAAATPGWPRRDRPAGPPAARAGQVRPQPRGPGRRRTAHRASMQASSSAASIGGPRSRQPASAASAQACSRAAEDAAGADQPGQIPFERPATGILQSSQTLAAPDRPAARAHC